MPNYLHIKNEKYNWYHFDKPLTPEDASFLSDNYRFSQEDLDNCKNQKTPRPKINITSSYSYFIFHIPYSPPNSKNLTVSELNVFITKTALITVESRGDLAALNHYLETSKTSPKLAESRFQHGPADLFVKLIQEITSNLSELIDKQGQEIDRLHREVFSNKLAKKFIEHVSLIRYNHIVAHNALERQVRIFDQFRGDKNPLRHFLRSPHKWNKILDLFHSINYEIESDIDHLEGLVKTFESLVTFRTNEIIKLLTVFSVILLPLTLISGIYGMNFRYLPLSLDPFGFTAILIFMFVLAMILVVVFKRKRWL